MYKLHIVTVVTESKYYFPYLVQSCENNGVKLTVLGYGEKWKGFNWKFKLVLDFLKKLNNNDIICFIDGYDVLCCRKLDEFVSEFLKIKNKTGCKMIVAHEKLFFINKIAKYYFDTCKNLSLNSGTYVAFKDDMFMILNKIYQLNSKDDADDQILLVKYCKMNEQNNNIYIDINNELFLTIAHSLNDIDSHIIYSNNSIKYDNQRPFFIHAPGYGYMDNIIIKLGYADKCNIRNELFYNFFKKKCLLYFFAIVTLQRILIFFIILIFGIILYYFYKTNKVKFKNNKFSKKY